MAKLLVFLADWFLYLTLGVDWLTVFDSLVSVLELVALIHWYMLNTCFSLIIGATYRSIYMVYPGIRWRSDWLSLDIRMITLMSLLTNWKVKLLSWGAKLFRISKSERALNLLSWSSFFLMTLINSSWPALSFSSNLLNISADALLR